MQLAPVVNQHLTVVANPISKTARIEVPAPTAGSTFAIEVCPAVLTDGWEVRDSSDDEAVWRASFAAALDEAILQAMRVLKKRVHRETGELAATVRARATADIC